MTNREVTLVFEIDRLALSKSWLDAINVTKPQCRRCSLQIATTKNANNCASTRDMAKGFAAA